MEIQKGKLLIALSIIDSIFFFTMFSVFEIIRIPSRTLYAQLNHCVTAFGKRLLKTWLARPLYHVESIKERQEAVASLRVNFIFNVDYLHFDIPTSFSHRLIFLKAGTLYHSLLLQKYADVWLTF